MAKLDSLTGRGATRVTLSVLEGMGRGVRGGSGEARRDRKRGSHTIM